ncbi:MAG: dockerin type I domain-containing protein [Bacteroidales bacterium]
MLRKLLLLSTILIAVFAIQTHAQLQVTSLGNAFTIDFETTVPGVNESALESAATQPFMENPPAAGQLDANAWALVMDNADTVTMNPSSFPGTGIANFATVTASGTSSTGWGAWNLSDDHAVAMLPSGSYATPAGHFTLKANNASGSSIDNLEISYYVAAYNDQPRSSKVIFFYSTDNVTYTKVQDAIFASSLAANATWEFATKTIFLSGLSIGTGQDFFLRWVFADNGGSGSRDELLLDDISVTASTGGGTVATQLAITTINNGIFPSATEPFSVTVQAQNSNGVPTNVTSALTITLGIVTGSGILEGNFQGSLEAGNHTVVITGVIYNQAETGVSLSASAQGLTAGTSALFNVSEPASQFVFEDLPDTAVCGMNLISYLSTFKVKALRPDNSLDSNFLGNAYLTLVSGPGNLLGTTTRALNVGVASFNDIRFDTPGTYVISASGPGVTDAISLPITVLAGPGIEELVVPQYMGSKSAASTNNCRTPFAICVNFSGLLPDEAYDMRLSWALTGEAVTNYGAGNTWNGTAFSGSNFLNAFTTNGDGSTGPIWFYVQPTGNNTRFEAGQKMNMRMSVVPSGQTMPITPMFVGTKIIDVLDIPSTPRTTATTDDGAFVRGVTDTTYSGKMFLVFDNPEGSGDPLYSFQIRTIVPFTTFANNELPGAIDSVWRELPVGEKGVFAGVIPISENNPNGVRRFEIREMDNTILSYKSDDDGIWPSGANSNMIARRDILNLSLDDLSLTSTITGTVTYNNTNNSVMDSTHVYLYTMNNVLVKTAMTDANGTFTMEGVYLGNYKISAMPLTLHGGANAIDALQILRHFVGMISLSGLNRVAADVNGGGVVNSADALMVQKRFVGLIDTFPVGDWVSETMNVSITEVGTSIINLKVQCTGDVNASFIP